MIDDPKRKFRRKPLGVEIRARDQSGAGEVTFDTHDLSLGGAFLKSDLLLEMGELLDVEIPMSAGPPLRVTARVVRAVRTGDLKSGPGMGIEFINASAEVKAALAELISR